MDIETIEQTPDRTRIQLRGRLDTPGVDRIETRLNAALRTGGHGIIDLSEVTFLSSLGVRLLIGAAKLVHKRGARLVLVAPPGLVAQALEHSSLDQILPVVGRLDEAEALLGR